MCHIIGNKDTGRPLLIMIDLYSMKQVFITIQQVNSRVLYSFKHLVQAISYVVVVLLSSIVQIHVWYIQLAV